MMKASAHNRDGNTLLSRIEVLQAVGMRQERRPSTDQSAGIFKIIQKLLQRHPIPEDQAEVVLVVEEQLRVLSWQNEDPKAGRRLARKLTPAKKCAKRHWQTAARELEAHMQTLHPQAQLIEYLYLNDSSIRPSELDDIRTYPKKEVEIIRRSHKTKPKSGPTEIYDKRTKSKEARFVGDQTAFNENEKRGLARDSEKLLGLSSVSQKLTILADTRESSNQEVSQADRDGPSPRFLRPQPTAQSMSPDSARVQYPQQSSNSPSATMLRQDTLPQQILQPSTLPPKIIYQQVQAPQPSIDPDFVRETNEKLAKAEEMVKKLTTQTSLLETTNAALKSQLLSQESRVLEIERRERYEIDRKQQLENEKRVREEEAKVAAIRLQDAEKAKEDAISIVKTLESANKNLQKAAKHCKIKCVSIKSEPIGPIWCRLSYEKLAISKSRSFRTKCQCTGNEASSRPERSR